MASTAEQQASTNPDDLFRACLHGYGQRDSLHSGDAEAQPAPVRESEPEADKLLVEQLKRLEASQARIERKLDEVIAGLLDLSTKVQLMRSGGRSA